MIHSIIRARNLVDIDDPSKASRATRTQLLCCVKPKISPQDSVQSSCLFMLCHFLPKIFLTELGLTRRKIAQGQTAERIFSVRNFN